MLCSTAGAGKGRQCNGSEAERAAADQCCAVCCHRLGQERCLRSRSSISAGHPCKASRLGPGAHLLNRPPSCAKASRIAIQSHWPGPCTILPYQPCFCLGPLRDMLMRLCLISIAGIHPILWRPVLCPSTCPLVTMARRSADVAVCANTW